MKFQEPDVDKSSAKRNSRLARRRPISSPKNRGKGVILFEDPTSDAYQGSAAARAKLRQRRGTGLGKIHAHIHGQEPISQGSSRNTGESNIRFEDLQPGDIHQMSAEKRKTLHSRKLTGLSSPASSGVKFGEVQFSIGDEPSRISNGSIRAKIQGRRATGLGSPTKVTKQSGAGGVKFASDIGANQGLDAATRKKIQGRTLTGLGPSANMSIIPKGKVKFSHESDQHDEDNVTTREKIKARQLTGLGSNQTISRKVGFSPGHGSRAQTSEKIQNRRPTGFASAPNSGNTIGRVKFSPSNTKTNGRDEIARVKIQNRQLTGLRQGQSNEEEQQSTDPSKKHHQRQFKFFA